MNDTGTLTPQLMMIREGLDGLPEVALPPGYRLATFREGDGEHWGAIIDESFGKPPGHCRFDAMMRGDPAFRPERVFFVLHGDEPVATASAWRYPMMPDAGAVHYLGVRAAHQGRRLGYWVSLAALHRIRDEGLNRACLMTDDFRLPAIKTYLRLGFVPLLAHESQRGRWQAVFARLGMPELAERFGGILTGPVWQKPEPLGGDAQTV